MIMPAQRAFSYCSSRSGELQISSRFVVVDSVLEGGLPTCPWRERGDGSSF